MINNLYIKAINPSAGGVGATLIKTGQTTSYRTGDDGDLEEGRATNFTTLAVNNPFGNTNRFTDELGGSTYTNNIVIDWSTYDTVAGTVLGIYRTIMANNTWNNQIDACLALSIGTFSTGWRLFNINECINICNWDTTLSGRYNYPPFNISAAGYIQTSTTYQVTTLVMKILLGGGQILADGKANSHSGIAVRTFTVSGTTLS